MTELDLLAYGAIALVGLGLVVASYALGLNPPTVSPYLGLRGLKRQKALQEGGSFATVEPIVRFVAGLVGHLPLGRLRTRLERQLIQAGDLLGLTADEHIALS
ncbi:MAG TPA: hypothetical protein VFU21_04025, partial [Kofleriaceae bacterium]|nr:hypothetical protein [Kofleriaceae bacterium]